MCDTENHQPPSAKQPYSRNGNQSSLRMIPPCAAQRLNCATRDCLSYHSATRTPQHKHQPCLLSTAHTAQSCAAGQHQDLGMSQRKIQHLLHQQGLYRPRNNTSISKCAHMHLHTQQNQTARTVIVSTEMGYLQCVQHSSTHTYAHNTRKTWRSYTDTMQKAT